MRPLVIALLFACVGIPETGWARYEMRDVEEVPIERLIENVQRKIEAEPDNIVQWRYTLARLYSMAYARGTLTAETPKAPDSEVGLPYFPPWWELWREEKREAAEDQTRSFLAQAIQGYEDVLRRDPDHLYSAMGLAWCYEQDQQTEQAVAMYRRAHELAWSEEQSRDYLFRPNIMLESVDALLRLLPETAVEERAELTRRAEIIQARPLVMTPLVVPLTQAAGLPELIRPHARVWFDLLGGGQPTWWEWITDKAGWLVWDPQRRGRITSGRQLFGSVTWWIFWADGYQPLVLLDDDGDGWLRGPELDGLAIWQDRNRNGQSQQGEVRPVEAWGIIAIGCEPLRSTHGLLYHPRGVIWQDGTARPTYDWLPRERRSPADTPMPSQPMAPAMRTLR